MTSLGVVEELKVIAGKSYDAVGLEIIVVICQRFDTVKNEFFAVDYAGSQGPYVLDFSEERIHRLREYVARDLRTIDRDYTRQQ